MERPFKDKRPLGPFIFREQNEDNVFNSEEDVEKIAERLLRRVPADIRNIKYQGFFSEPSIFIDFVLQSQDPRTVTRDIFRSSVTADAETGNMKELSIRFPAIPVSNVDEDELQEFVKDIAGDFYRVRIVFQDKVEGPEPEYHPHIHYSKARLGEFGPNLQDEVSNLNRMMRKWYSEIDTVLF